MDTVDAGSVLTDLTLNLTSGATGNPADLVLSFEHLLSGDGNDNLTGTIRSNLISGRNGNDTIRGGNTELSVSESASDSLYGGSGNDGIYFFGGVSAYGGDDTDTLDTTLLTVAVNVNMATGTTNGAVTDGFENAQTGSGIDHLAGTTGANVIDNGIGNDTVDGSGGGDTLTGGEGNDLVCFDPLAMTYGGNGVDTVDTSHFTLNILLNLATGDTGAAGQLAAEFEYAITGIGDDTVFGSSVANRIDCGAGNDTITGVAGNDTLIGGDGDDIIVLSVDLNEAYGGASRDALDATAYAGDYLIDLESGTTGFGEVIQSFEKVYSGDGNDGLTGNTADNFLSSGNCDDTMLGGGGDDRLIGGDGVDHLASGKGADSLIGGLCNDIFVFGSTDQSAGLKHDTLMSTQEAALEGAGVALGDLIDLSDIDANRGQVGDQAFVLGRAGGRGTLSIVDVGRITLIQGNTDRDAAFEFELVILDGLIRASADTLDDFIL